MGVLIGVDHAHAAQVDTVDGAMQAGAHARAGEGEAGALDVAGEQCADQRMVDDASDGGDDLVHGRLVGDAQALDAADLDAEAVEAGVDRRAAAVDDHESLVGGQAGEGVDDGLSRDGRIDAAATEFDDDGVHATPSAGVPATPGMRPERSSRPRRMLTAWSA